MKELARILIYVPKMFNLRMFFKMMVSVCPITVEREPLT